MQILPPYKPAEQQAVWDYTIQLVSSAVPRATFNTPEPRDYRIRLTYRERQNGWYLNLYDSEDVAILTGYRVALGAFFGYFGIFGYQLPDFPDGQVLFGLDSTGSGVQCDFDGLGSRCFLMHSDQTDLAAETVAAADAAGVSTVQNDWDRPVSIAIAP